MSGIFLAFLAFAAAGIGLRSPTTAASMLGIEDGSYAEGRASFYTHSPVALGMKAMSSPIFVSTMPMPA
jgi:hypothetical protein